MCKFQEPREYCIPMQVLLHLQNISACCRECPASCTVACREKNSLAYRMGNNCTSIVELLFPVGVHAVVYESAVIDGQYIHSEVFESFSDIAYYVFLLLS